MAHVPALQRRKWRMAGHRAERRGGGAFEPLVAGGEETFVAELARLHGERRRAQGEAGLFEDARVAAFLRSALPRLLAAGLADGSCLRFGDEIAGFYLGLRDDRRAYAWCGGFSHRFSRESPGTLLVGRAIGQAAARGATEFHFLRGDERYKRAWGAVDRVNTFLELARA
jgi:CelD/BcsL family acetyltransferase involved in cellulose biosynthesis